MKNHFYLTGAQIVLPNETLNDAAVLIEEGVITAIDPASHQGATEVSLKGCMLLTVELLYLKISSLHPTYYKIH